MRDPRLQKHFRHAEYEEVERLRPITEGVGIGHGLISFSPNGLSTLVVYSILKENFGPPNDLREGEKVQWEFLLKGPNSYLAVYDWKFSSWSIGVRYWSNATSDEHTRTAMPDAKLLLSILTKAAKGRILNVESHERIVFGNVFFENYSKGKELLDKLQQAEKNSRMYEEEETHWAACVAFLLSAEAFLNLAYSIYLKPEFQGDEILNQHIAQMSLLDKWRLASSLLVCLRRPLLKEGKGYGYLKRIVRLRNGLVHPAIGEKDKVYGLTMDGYLFYTKKDAIDEKHVENVGIVNLKSVLEIKKFVDGMTSEFLDSMYKKHRKVLSSVLGIDTIQLAMARTATSASEN